jgi:hypothetical protein
MDEKWQVPEKFMIPLGGEGRFAEVTVEEKDAEDDSVFLASLKINNFTKMEMVILR